MPAWPQILIPATYQDASGLWRASDLPEDLSLPPELPVELRPQPSFLVPSDPSPFRTEIRPYLSLADLGLPLVSKDELIGWIQGLPFEPSMRLAASMQRDLKVLGSSDEGQRALLKKWLGGSPFALLVEATLRKRPTCLLVSEPQLFAFQRLLVLYANDEMADGLTPEQAVLLIRALFAIPDAILGEALGGHDGDPPLAPDAEDEVWMRLFIANGGLVGFDGPMPEIARGYHLYADLARSERAVGHPDYCPIEEWLMDAFGLGYAELQALGVGLWTASQMLTNEADHPMIVERTCFDSTPLRELAERGFNAFAAPRAWYGEAFSRHQDTPRRAALFHTPFLERPGVSQADGKIALIAPRAIEGWLGVRGTYYRLLSLARQRNLRSLQQFQRFFGHLLEWHALDVAEAAYPPQQTSLHYVGRVLPEQTYRAGRQEMKTSDVAIDLGFDLILFEITASRFTEKSLVDADTESIRADITKTAIHKLGQLDRVITDLQDGRAVLPDVEMGLVERIWPVVVTGDFIWKNPALHAHIASGTHGLLKQAKVQHYTLLNMEDYERVLDLPAQGYSLAEFLRLKTGPQWRERDFVSWHTGDPRRFGSGRSRYLESLYFGAFERFMAILGFAAPSLADRPPEH